ncbi:Protein pellino [Eumeta japonica]|uniref:Protein pellino n=1 Tax=Eumeta variegata TaxID=151549 RepID=A0A4C1VC99_EUMVA|nr:Protein pellino [Eumeta japonica]
MSYKLMNAGRIARKSMTHCRVPLEPSVRARVRNELSLFHSIGRCVRVEERQRPHTTYTYNGYLPAGERGRRRSKFVLYRRPQANGVRRSKHYVVKTPHSSKAILDASQHSISYTLSRNQAVIVEYTEDPDTDMFQYTRKKAWKSNKEKRKLGSKVKIGRMIMVFVVRARIQLTWSVSTASLERRGRVAYLISTWVTAPWSENNALVPAVHAGQATPRGNL